MVMDRSKGIAAGDGTQIAGIRTRRKLSRVTGGKVGGAKADNAMGDSFKRCCDMIHSSIRCAVNIVMCGGNEDEFKSVL